MIRVLCFIILLFLNTNIWAQDLNAYSFSKPENFYLSGHVKSVETYELDLKSGKKSIFKKLKFDSLGNLIYSKSFNEIDSISIDYKQLKVKWFWRGYGSKGYVNINLDSVFRFKELEYFVNWKDSNNVYSNEIDYDTTLINYSSTYMTVKTSLYKKVDTIYFDNDLNYKLLYKNTLISSEIFKNEFEIIKHQNNRIILNKGDLGSSYDT